MRKKRILAILSNILGNRTLSSRYLDVLKSMADYELNFFFVEGEDYTRYPARGLTRFSSALRLADIAKRKYSDCNLSDYDLLFINGYEIAYGLIDQVKTHPTILALDVVPSLVHELLVRTSENYLQKLRSYIFGRLTARLMAGMFRAVRVFLPMANWCGEALNRDYAIREENIFVTHAPANLSEWIPDFQRHDDGGARLLFVGNDFKRKGGDFLLDLFQKYFKNQNVKLILVSSDPFLSKEGLSEGVELYQNVDHDKMVHIFQSVDMFVFPTKKEYLGVVATEACCVGLPVIARDVGGLNEFILDGYNGYLLPYESGEKEWVGKIQYLIDHPQERRRMGENSRKLAEEMFSMEKFEETVKQAIEKALKNDINSAG